MTTVMFEGSSMVGLRWSQPLHWYLREERLEVQVWAAYGKGRGARPCNTDSLLGSAFIDLSELARLSTQKQTISGESFHFLSALLSHGLLIRNIPGSISQKHSC